MVLKGYGFSRKYISNIDFCSFLGLVLDSRILPHDAEMWQRAAAPSQAWDHEGEQLTHLQPFCTHTVFLFFTLSI